MPKPIEEYRALVIGGLTTVRCGCGFTGCEGTIALDIAWHVCTDMENAFSGDDWKEAFPEGFHLEDLTVEHMQQRRLIVCGHCKEEIKAGCKRTNRKPLTFLLLKRTADDLANGRLQHDKDHETNEELRRNKQVLEYLQDIPLGVNGNGKRRKLSARDVVRGNGQHLKAAATA